MSSMLNSKVLTSGPQYFSLDCPINPYYPNSTVDTDRAITEHTAICSAFKSAGIEVVKVLEPKNCQDGVYTANWALVRDGTAVMARLPNARKAEEDYAKAVLQDLGYETIAVPEGLRYSGQGDSLPLFTSRGDFLLAGQGYRSDLQAQQFTADMLGFELVQLQTVPQLDAHGRPTINAISDWADSFFYDIDLAICVISPNLIAYCADAFTPESQVKLEQLPVEKIVVSLDEAQTGFACNLVSTGETVIMSNQAPNLQAELKKRGYKTITPEVTELKKGGGFIRCVSLTL